MTPALALALAFLQSDPAADLRSADPTVRERATEALIQRGEEEPVRALLADPDPEVRGRAQMIVEEIGRRRRMEERLGPFHRVTLSATEEPLVDVLRRLREESGLPLRLVGVPSDAVVTVDAHDVTPAEAAMAACRASGVARFDPATMTVRGGAPADPPRSIDGRWGVWLTGVSWRRGSTGARVAWSDGELRFAVTWACLEDPCGVEVVVFDLENENGADLTPIRGRGWAAGEPPARGGCARSLHVRNPPDAERLTVEGEGRIRFAARSEDVLVDLTEDRSGSQTRPAGSSWITVSWVRAAGAPMQVTVQMAGAGPGAETAMPTSVALTDGEGARIEGRRSSGWTTQRASARVYEFDLPEGREPAGIVVTVPTEVETVRVPFRFEGVPLR